MLRFLLIALSFGLLTACATTVPVDPPVDVELDPLVLRADRGKVEAFQARPLFKEATEDYSSGRYEPALTKFRRIIEHFNYTPQPGCWYVAVSCMGQHQRHLFTASKWHKHATTG